VKRGDLLRELRKIAAAKGMELSLVRHGASHDVYDIGGVTFIVARHNDITEMTARATIRRARAL
jgi:hypothetical protein